MIFIYGEQLSSIEWEIFQNNDCEKVKFLSSQFNNIDEIAETVLQNSLFIDDSIFCIDITKFNLKEKKVINLLKNIVTNDVNVILYSTNKNYKVIELNEIFATKKLISKKVYNLNENDCHKIVNFIANKKQIKFEIKVQLALEKKLPPDYKLIMAEIDKLVLLEKNITVDDVNNIVFDHFNANIFMITQFLFKNKIVEAIKTIDTLLIKNNNVTELIPIFSQQLFQLKLYLISRKNGWDYNLINSRYQITYFVQKIYSEMLYNNDDNKIDSLLNDLYQLDLKIKTKEVEPYSGLISILLKE